MSEQSIAHLTRACGHWEDIAVPEAKDDWDYRQRIIPWFHSENLKPCLKCHPTRDEPAPKHDGKIGHQPVYTIRYLDGVSGIVISGPAGVQVYHPDEALSLLAWLQQEKPELERLAKEQEG